LVSIDGPSFSQVRGPLTGTIASDEGTDSFHSNGPLTITPEAGMPVPEASTWAMMLLGFAGLALAGFRRHAILTRQRQAAGLA
jgi:hypothetical protein